MLITEIDLVFAVSRLWLMLKVTSGATEIDLVFADK